MNNDNTEDRFHNMNNIQNTWDPDFICEEGHVTVSLGTQKILCYQKFN